MFEVVVVEMRALVRGLQPETMTPNHAALEFDSVLRLEKLVAAAKLLLARRAADSTLWRKAGARTPAEWVARQSGTTAGQAARLLEASEKVGGLAATEEAVRSGELSEEQAEAVTGAASVDPSAEAPLLAQAKHDSLPNLRAEAARRKAAATSDEERYETIRKNRFLRMGTDAEGAGWGQWRTTADQHARIAAHLKPFIDHLFEQARREGRRESPEAYAIDALDAMARAAAGGRCDGEAGARKSPGKVIVRVDWDAFWRGHTTSGETCDVAGVGPVPVTVVREWVATGDVFVAAILTKGVDVLNVAHLGRRPTAHQQTALEWLDPVCRTEGCCRAVAEWDHRKEWAATQQTLLSDMEGLCAHHHDLKTYRGYRVIDSPLPGKIRLLPPDTPDPP